MARAASGEQGGDFEGYAEGADYGESEESDSY